MSEKQKVLIAGDVEGHFKFLFSKVENINKKNGPFDFLLCVGNFFGVNNVELEPYKNGIKSIPVPTYIIGPNKKSDIVYYPDDNGFEICQNLTYLGKHGLYCASSGLKIAYISGIEKQSDETDAVTFNENDIVAIRNSCLKGQPGFRGVDILLSSPWPEGITNLDPKKPNIKYNGSKLLAWLAVQVRPRYHISAIEGVHYERPPYRNISRNDEGCEIATRFIALAPVANNQKADSPSSQASGDRQTQFFYDMNSKENGKRSRNSTGPHKRQKQEFDQAKCWFCLSSPEVSKHLVISVGTEVYVALAKGGLVEDHFLVLPITHHQSLSILPENVKDEMKLYKEAISKYYASMDKVAVFFERNYKTSHCQLQSVPVHKNQAGDLREMFEEMAESNNFKIDELPAHSDLQQIAQPGVLYFYVELPSGEKLYHRIKKDFPLQFGREVLASDRILDLNDRADWRDCQMDKEGETELAKKIRKQFAPFDLDN
ncbi:CWF19-like protein 1 isoform X2 [Prorops nasuta]|uniref:CWF19-like protein 1 isoform X2 n=1 Tax=Prorops nasuta TaxID=863751 RepID=UPI0034CDA23F